jgi:histidyl-tRNA synthetase
LGKQFKYAASRGVPFVAVLGDEERQHGTVAVKDMRSGEQQAVSRAELAGYLRSRLWLDAST